MKSIAAATVLKNGISKNETCYKKIWGKIGDVSVIEKSGEKMTMTNAKNYDLSQKHRNVHPEFNFTCVPSSQLNHNSENERRFFRKGL